MSSSAIQSAASEAVYRLADARRRGAAAALTATQRKALAAAADALRSGGVSDATIAKVFGTPPGVARSFAANGAAATPAQVRMWKAWARAQLQPKAQATPHPAPPATPATGVVEAQSVVKRWGNVQALAGVSLTFNQGVTGLLGANGAGKTTLLGMILGLHRPDEGTIRVLGRDPAASGPEVRARIGYSPEHEGLPGDVKAHDFVRHVAEIHGIPRRDAVARASDALFLVGLGEERYRPVGTMSTGQKQRVKLAQAIAHDPELVLLDEPTNGLDPVQRDEMLGLIHQIGSELDLNVILSSHLLEEVERICDAAVILDTGRLVAAGSMAQLRGAGEDIFVEVDGDPQPLLAALAKTKSAAHVQGGRVVVSFDGETTYDLVRDAAAASATSIRKLGRRTSSLEDVFLRTGP